MTSGEERAIPFTRDAAITAVALGAAALLAWWWLGAMSMGGMSEPAVWTPAYAFAVFVMWAIMMVAMMLPSAMPMILLYARVAGQQGASGVLPPTFVFAGAYVGVWTAAAALATLGQWALASSGLLTPAMRLGDTTLAGALLIGAGLYQLTPMKRLCLANCRAPLTFLMRSWRPGTRGAIRMGVEHGAYCVGCCWFVMALLFAGGVMNLIWVVAIAAFVLAEKVLPFGDIAGRAAGFLAVGAGIWAIVAG